MIGRLTSLKLVVVVISLSLIVAGCSPTAAPGSAAGATTAPVPAVSPSAPAAPAGSVPLAASDSMRFVLVPDGTQARYRVREQLARLSFPSDAVGTTNAVSGQVVVNPDGTVVREQSKIVVDLRALQSDESRRDNFIRNNTLQTNQFPTAEFVPTAVQGLASPLPASGEGKFQLIGDLTIHGVTRPVTWDVTARLDGQDLTGTATTSFKFEDFGMSVPHAFVVLSVDDNIRLELDFHFVRQS